MRILPPIKKRFMNLKAIKLDNNTYHEYLSGKEVTCSASDLANKSLHEGEHILVYKDSVAASTSVTLPRGEMQSEYIGIEGLVKHVDAQQQGVVIQKL
jgi:hypothetical protein